jgi:hypothetical protein
MYRPFHGKKGGLENIDPVDGFFAHQANADLRTDCFKRPVQFDPFGMGKFFGILKKEMVAVRGKYDTGGNNRSGEGTPAHFIASGYTQQPSGIERSFNPEVIFR